MAGSARVACFVILLATLQCLASEDTKCSTSALEFSSKNYRNLTGHWISETTVTGDSATSSKEPWGYDISFKRVKCGDRETRQTIIRIIDLPKSSTPTMVSCEDFTFVADPTWTPEDYTLHEGVGYYKLHKKPMLWSEARGVCVREGAHLAIVNSLQEATIIRNMTCGDCTEQFWTLIDFSDLALEDRWFTNLGDSQQSTGYMQWAPNEPDGRRPALHCGCLNILDGAVGACNCDIHRSFVCERFL